MATAKLDFESFSKIYYTKARIRIIVFFQLVNLQPHYCTMTCFSLLCIIVKSLCVNLRSFNQNFKFKFYATSFAINTNSFQYLACRKLPKFVQNCYNSVEIYKIIFKIHLFSLAIDQTSALFFFERLESIVPF